MTTTYVFSVTGSFPSGSVDATKLHFQISSSIDAFEFLNILGDEVDTLFTASLNSSSLSILNTIIATHDGIPFSTYGTNFEDFLVLTGSRSMSGSLQMAGHSIISASNINGVDIENHELRHIYGGQDSIDGDKLGIDFVPVAYVPDSLASGSGDIHDLTAHLSGIDHVLSASLGSNFGKNFINSENSASFTTTSNVFQQASLVNFICNTTGQYRIGWEYIWNHENAGDSIVIQILLDNSIELLFPRQFERPANGGTIQRHENHGFKYLNLISGSHNIKLNVRSESNGKKSSIYFSEFEIWRVS